jgi:inorganic pyrophosphatase
MRALVVACAVVLSIGTAAEDHAPSNVLPVSAVRQLATSLDAARPHERHVWRDTPPLNADDTVNAYVEIARGARDKWEFDMRANRRALDRVIPAQVGGYPVNYGFVPQTVSYDGDPFDVLVLGPPIDGGTLVRGVVVGLMQMVDEKGSDAKVVVSPVGPDGRAVYPLSDRERDSIGRFFQIYKRYEPGGFSRVPGWSSAADGRAHVLMTHTFFTQCRQSPSTGCTVTR